MFGPIGKVTKQDHAADDCQDWTTRPCVNLTLMTWTERAA